MGDPLAKRPFSSSTTKTSSHKTIARVHHHQLMMSRLVLLGQLLMPSETNVHSLVR